MRSSFLLQARNKEIRLKEKTKGILGMATAGTAATVGAGIATGAGAALKAFGGGKQADDAGDQEGHFFQFRWRPLALSKICQNSTLIDICKMCTKHQSKSKGKL